MGPLSTGVFSLRVSLGSKSFLLDIFPEEAHCVEKQTGSQNNV